MSAHPPLPPRHDPLAIASTPRLGPYQTEYDVRRGYEEEPSPAPAAGMHRATHDPGWVGRRRDER